MVYRLQCSHLKEFVKGSRVSCPKRRYGYGSNEMSKTESSRNSIKGVVKTCLTRLYKKIYKNNAESVIIITIARLPVPYVKL